MYRRTFFRIAVALLLVGGSCLAPVVRAQSPAKQYVIVANAQGKGSTSFLKAVAEAQGKVTANIEAIGVVLAESSNPNFLAAMGQVKGVQQIAEDVMVQWIPDYSNAIGIEEANLTPASVNAEPGWAFQWNIRNIKADVTAAAGIQGEGVKRARVAVLDSGIWKDHPDIAPNLNVGLSRSFVPAEPGIEPIVLGFSHGSHVSGIIAAPINDRGVQGVAPRAEIVFVKVLSSDTGSGSFGWLIQGILYASGPTARADVINMSLGATFDRINAGGGGAGPLIAALNRAINYATSAGTLCVSAAGNEGVNLDSRLWSIPAQSGNGMAVSATGPINFAHLGDNAPMNRLASYSNYGQSVVNVAAPGGDFVLYTEDPSDPNYDTWHLDMVLSPAGKLYVNPSNPTLGYRYVSYWAAGTSMAAPHVSGVAALVVGRYGKLPPSQIKAIIENSADDILKPGADSATGKGRINAWRAVNN